MTASRLAPRRWPTNLAVANSHSSIHPFSTLLIMLCRDAALTARTCSGCGSEASSQRRLHLRARASVSQDQSAAHALRASIRQADATRCPVARPLTAHLLTALASPRRAPSWTPASAIDVPPASVRYPARSLHVDVDHVARTARDHCSRLAARLAAWVDELPTIEAKRDKVTVRPCEG